MLFFRRKVASLGNAMGNSSRTRCGRHRQYTSGYRHGGARGVVEAWVQAGLAREVNEPEPATLIVRTVRMLRRDGRLPVNRPTEHRRSVLMLQQHALGHSHGLGGGA